MQDFDLSPYLSQIVLPKQDGVKGDGGRVLVIGGSRLFHAASFWSASMASRIVDMVHFTSPAMENNDLMRVKAKKKFWDGIVVPYDEVDHYIREDDVILIGPGMERGGETQNIVNHLLKKNPEKKWVVDGGALQELDPSLLTQNMIITPNVKELALLNSKLSTIPLLPSTILSKGPTDTIYGPRSTIYISGGSPGLTKGGTGDVLAGLVAGFYAKSPGFASCVVASYTNKLASEELAKTVGPFFSPTDLITQIPKTLKQINNK
jgi:NAD(P)H-hydrate epimerase